MSDSIDPEEDRTSDEEINQGQICYDALLAQGSDQGIAISVLDGPKIEGGRNTCAASISSLNRLSPVETRSSAKRSRT